MTAKKPQNGKKRILLVDDHPVVREGFAQLINHEPDLVVCAQTGSPAEAAGLVKRHQPHLAIVDLSLGDTSGLTLVRDLLCREPALPILILSMHDESTYAERALRSGARGFVMKQAPVEEVMKAIHAVLSGDNYVSERIKAQMVATLVAGQKPASLLERLSDRELEVFGLIGRGKTTREIAAAIGISIKTVETYRGHIKEKIGAHNGAELGRQAAAWVAREEAPQNQPS
jgi:DNA-binding NarL/FixJ family response regulator